MSNGQSPNTSATHNLSTCIGPNNLAHLSLSGKGKLSYLEQINTWIRAENRQTQAPLFPDLNLSDRFRSSSKTSESARKRRIIVTWTRLLS